MNNDADATADIAAVIAALGGDYRIAVQCRVCGRWLVAKESVRHQLGPRCRERSGRRTEAA